MRTLTHRQARQLAQAALDGELPAERRRAFEAHLESCPECRTYAGDLTRLEDALQQLGRRQRRQPRAVPDFTSLVRRRMQRETERGFWLRLGGGLAQAASLVLATALAWQIISAPGGSFEADPAIDLAAGQASAAPAARAAQLPAVEFDEADAADLPPLPTPLLPAPANPPVPR